MDNFILELAARIIESSDREHPADSVLRLQLKTHGGLSPRQMGRVSRAVFAYFRWLEWLDQQRGLSDQINQAQELAERFVQDPSSFSEAELAAKVAPAWVGDEMEISGPWARSLQGEPKVWLRARPDQGQALAAKLCDPIHGAECLSFGEGALSDALEFKGETDLFRTPEFHAGEFELQDLSSQAVGLVCAPNPGETWWDACAGEGGKMLHFSDLMKNQGLIWASDRAEWRLKRLKRRAARAQVFNYRTKLWDGGSKLPTKTKFDGVLMDAPCSGVGTWHRNPHARWTTTVKDIEELGDLQTRLLGHAAAAVKPNGKLIYAVCTLTRRETIGVVENFEKQFPMFKPLMLRNPLDVDGVESKEMRLRTEVCGGNGMFVAVWRREG